MTDLHDEYHFYWTGPFSQWQPSTIELDEVVFNSAEQAMMYLKAKLFGDDEIATQILLAEDPGKQKALGQKVAGFDNATWDANKGEIVLRINLAKFRQNKGLRRKLFQTGAKLLVEASPVDTIWGIGLDAATASVTPPSDWPGQNLLGKTLTKVKAELRLEYPDEAVAL
ncbi:MAG: NADAR family protein [Litoreibacter sp.]|uniref:NADAR family protein n=1 Tax=Litoreibacter sp. TaxID=1969459 RepID=UPI0032983938